MNAEILKRALSAGVAFRRRLSNCHDLVWVPDMEFATVLFNPTPAPLFDFSKCKRLSRGKAHKVVNLMADEPAPLKAFYHGLIDGKQGGEE